MRNSKLVYEFHVPIFVAKPGETSVKTLDVGAEMSTGQMPPEYSLNVTTTRINSLRIPDVSGDWPEKDAQA
jgi:hypothetical protein